jgi:hypothetical protein
LNKLVPALDQTEMKDLQPKLRRLLRSGFGSNTRCGVCDFYNLIVTENPAAITKSMIEDTLVLVSNSLTDPSIAVKTKAASLFATLARRTTDRVKLAMIIRRKLLGEKEEKRRSMSETKGEREKATEGEKSTEGKNAKAAQNEATMFNTEARSAGDSVDILSTDDLPFLEASGRALAEVYRRGCDLRSLDHDFRDELVGRCYFLRFVAARGSVGDQRGESSSRKRESGSGSSGGAGVAAADASGHADYSTMSHEQRNRERVREQWEGLWQELGFSVRTYIGPIATVLRAGLQSSDRQRRLQSAQAIITLLGDLGRRKPEDDDEKYDGEDSDDEGKNEGKGSAKPGRRLSFSSGRGVGGELESLHKALGNSIFMASGSKSGRKGSEAERTATNNADSNAMEIDDIDDNDAAAAAAESPEESPAESLNGNESELRLGGVSLFPGISLVFSAMAGVSERLWEWQTEEDTALSSPVEGTSGNANLLSGSSAADAKTKKKNEEKLQRADRKRSRLQKLLSHDIVSCSALLLRKTQRVTRADYIELLTTLIGLTGVGSNLSSLSNSSSTSTTDADNLDCPYIDVNACLVDSFSGFRQTKQGGAVVGKLTMLDELVRPGEVAVTSAASDSPESYRFAKRGKEFIESAVLSSQLSAAKLSVVECIYLILSDRYLNRNFESYIEILKKKTVGGVSSDVAVNQGNLDGLEEDGEDSLSKSKETDTTRPKLLDEEEIAKTTKGTDNDLLLSANPTTSTGEGTVSTTLRGKPRGENLLRPIFELWSGAVIALCRRVEENVKENKEAQDFNQLRQLSLRVSRFLFAFECEFHDASGFFRTQLLRELTQIIQLALPLVIKAGISVTSDDYAAAKTYNNAPPLALLSGFLLERTKSLVLSCAGDVRGRVRRASLGAVETIAQQRKQAASETHKLGRSVENTNSSSNSQETKQALIILTKSLANWLTSEELRDFLTSFEAATVEGQKVEATRTVEPLKKEGEEAYDREDGVDTAQVMMSFEGGREKKMVETLKMMLREMEG